MCSEKANGCSANLAYTCLLEESLCQSRLQRRFPLKRSLARCIDAAWLLSCDMSRNSFDRRPALTGGFEFWHDDHPERSDGLGVHRPPFFKHDPVWHRIMQQTDKRCCQKARCAIEYARTMLLSCKQCLHTQGYVACCREGRGWAVWNFELLAWSCPTCFDTIINIIFVLLKYAWLEKSAHSEADLTSVILSCFYQGVLYRCLELVG